jgi:hypothetical protein
MLQSLATYAVTAIQEVRLLDAVQEVAQLLLSQPCQKVLDHLSLVANDLLNASSSAIWILEDQELKLVASSGADRHRDRIPLQRSQIGQAVLQRKPVATNDLDSDPLADARGWSRALIVPLLMGTNGQALGAFSVFSTDPQAGRLTESEWDEKVLTFLAHYAALAVQNESHQQALRTSQEQHWIAEAFAAVGDVSANLLHNMNNKVGTIPVGSSYSGQYGQLLNRFIPDQAWLRSNTARWKHADRAGKPLAPAPHPLENGDRLLRQEAIRTTSTFRVQSKSRGWKNADGDGGNKSPLFKNLISSPQWRGGLITLGLLPMGGSSITDSGRHSSRPHDKIFELNFSAPVPPGKLGFGLWWVKNLMTRLGGSVLVESDGRHGTTFLLRLPCAEVERKT